MQAFFILSTQHRADASTPERKSVSMKKKVKVISSLSLAATLIVPSAIVGFAADDETTENPTVSVVNFSPESGNKSTNIASMSKIIEQADEQGTDIIVFPEMSVTGYSKEIPVALAESKTGSTAAYFSDLAEKYDMYIVYGAPETVPGDSTHAYDSAFVCTPDGKVDSYQKMLVSADDSSCKAGSTPVYFDTKFGKVGLSVGNDAADLIELSRIYSADDCFMIADCNSIETEDYTKNYDFSDAVYCDYTKSYYNLDWTDYNRNSTYNVVYQAGLYVASANLKGTYDDSTFSGGSMLAGINSLDEYNKIWSMWQSSIDKNADFTDYIIKVYAGGEESSDTLCTGTVDLSTVTHELVDMDIYQPNLYKEWYSQLAEYGTSLTKAPTTTDSPTVAVVEMNPKWADKAANTEKMINYIEKAKAEGVNIITFPEMALADYASTSDPDSEIWKSIVENAETTDGYYANLIAKAAADNNMYVIYGTAEVNPDDEQHPFNSAFVATPEGKTLTYRKVQVVEGDWATWGVEPLIIDTPWGGMGISICMDTYAYPELARYYAAAGCKILVNPTASTGYAGSNFIYNNAISSIVARDNMALLSCDLVDTSGYQDSMLYPGKSTIIEPNGVSSVYLTTETMTKEKMLTATLDLSNAGFDLENYNPSVMAKAFAALDKGNAVYDYSGLVTASEYASETEPDTTVAPTTSVTATASKDATSAASSVTTAPATSDTATKSSSSDNGAVKTGQATAIAPLAVLACAGGLSMYALKKKKEY